MKNYSGDPANITTPLAATIVQITDTTPPVVQTSAAHNYATNDYVYIDGNSLADPTVAYKIAVVDPTHYSLVGITGGGGPAVLGGTCRDISLTPSFAMADDGEYATAQSIEAAIQALADRTQFLQIKGYFRAATFTSNGTWISPVDGFALLEGWGAGGGGGGGYGNGTGTSTYGVGGGGGGGSLRGHAIVPVTKGTSYTVGVGTGGAGGAGGAAGNHDGTLGTFGGDTTFAAGATVLARFTGADGGFGATGGAVGSTDPTHMTWGGAPVFSHPGGFGNSIGETGTGTNTAGAASISQMKQPAQGGFGMTNGSGFALAAFAGDGTANPTGISTTTGTGGTGGTDSGTQFGGGPGGGGGSGPGGHGGNGGNGGNGNNAGAGAAGTTSGTGPVANSGAGGGGGGAGGTGSASGGAGATGQAGADGKLTIYYLGSVTQ